MRLLGSGTEWCVAGSKRWGEFEGPEHFKDDYIGLGYYVLISPNKISWKSKNDNGVVNEYSGLDKYCL